MKKILRFFYADSIHWQTNDARGLCVLMSYEKKYQSEIWFYFRENIKFVIMAKPIKITEPIEGRASWFFNQAISNVEKNKVSDVERQRIFSLVERVLAKSK